MAKNRKLQNFVISPVVQFRLSAYVVGCLVMFVGAFTSFSVMWWQDFTELLLELTEIPDEIRLFLREEVVRYLWLATGMLVGFVALTVGVIVVQTHRILGAAYAINRHINEYLKMGNYTRQLELRKDDYLQEVAIALNELSVQLKGQSDNAA